MNSSTREGQALRAIQLPLPANDRGMSVFAALQQRKTTREIGATPLPLQLLSNLLWAAFGVNRKTGPFGVPGRSAASASYSQEIDLYVALPWGAYVYEALSNRGEAGIGAYDLHSANHDGLYDVQSDPISL